MSMKYLLLRLAVALAASAAVFACAADGPASSDTQALVEQRASLHQQLVSAIGVPRATDLDLCRVLPVGNKVCGGPSEYLVYSVQVSDVSQLQNLAQGISDIDRRLQQAKNLASDCAMVAAPKLALVRHVCQVDTADGSVQAPQ